MASVLHQIEGYIQTIHLVEEGDHLMLLDGCSRPDVNVVQSFIENTLSKSLSDLKLVISTHAHPDHAGGLHWFKKKGILIAGPEELNQWYRGVSGFFTYLVDILLTYLVAMKRNTKFKNIIFPRTVKLDFILRENMIIPGFEQWQVLECPGHTSHDLSIYHAQNNVAYVADNFVKVKSRVFRPYPLFNPKQYKQSLQKYVDLGINDFLVAHYGRIEVSSERIKELIETTPAKPRRHLNTLPKIILTLVGSIFRK